MSSSLHTPAPMLGAALARNWWALALRAVLAILFGVAAIALPAATMLSLAMLFAVYALADGACALLGAIRAARADAAWAALLLEAVVDLATGIAILLWPGLSLLAFVMLVGAWAIASGALMLVASFRIGFSHGGLWLLFAGGASAIYGAILLTSPMLGAVVLAWWIGLYAIVFGIALMAAALLLRARHNESAMFF